MRKARIALFSPLMVAICVLLLPVQNQAQTRSTFVISARAGGVNAVTGRAAVRAHGNAEWQQLTIREDLQTGDMVKTGADGRVEMLLNPGSFLRIGENSEFELANNSLENLELRLIRGTAIVEATGADDSALQINITTPHAKLSIVRRGLYRLNVVPGDATELIVRKGRVMLDRSHTKIQGGNKVVFNNETFFIAKLDKAEKKKADNLDAWSKERAETVSQANRKLRGREMAMVMSGLNGYWRRDFSGIRNGYWFYSPTYGCYSFMPFGFGWGSPYGSSYTSSLFGNYYCCGRSLFAPSYRGYRPSGGTSSGGNPTPYPTITPSAPPIFAPGPPRSGPAIGQSRIDKYADRAPSP
ncbi:MAG: FecR family protein [Acidobacteriota bacterium]|nr:FecR family protein [Acidobacteriota bacterium]